MKGQVIGQLFAEPRMFFCQGTKPRERSKWSWHLGRSDLGYSLWELQIYIVCVSIYIYMYIYIWCSLPGPPPPPQWVWVYRRRPRSKPFFFKGRGGCQEKYYYATMLMQAKWTGKKQQERQGWGEEVAVTIIIWQSIRQCIGLASRSSYTRETGGEGGGGVNYYYCFFVGWVAEDRYYYC